MKRTRTIRLRRWTATILFALVGAASCNRAVSKAAPQPAVNAAPQPTVNGGTMEIRSDAFVDTGEIPSRYTCQGTDISPPLTFVDVPAATKSLVLIVDDPDAPDPAAPKMTWVHWVLYNLPPTLSGLPEDVKPVPDGTLEGLNDWKRTGWGGPCPPIGRHRYFFKLYALSDVLPDLGSPTKDDLLAAMEGKVLARAEMVGTYQK